MTPDLEQLPDLLPHGHPMLLVDRVVALDPGRSIRTEKAVSATEQCFGDVGRGDPPAGSAYPASLLLESFGQSAALLWLAGRSDGPVDDSRVLMLATARDCTVEGRAVPGDVITHVARIEHTTGDNVLVAGESFVGARRIATVRSMLAVMRHRDDLSPALPNPGGPR